MHPPLLHEKHFELLGPAGAGASCTVWRAHDTHSRQQVAIKILDGPPDPEQVLRLAQEVEILKKLDHPCIVKLHGTGVSREGNPFVVMEWLDGQSLREHLLQTPLPPRTEVLEIVAQVCSALVEAHMAGVVHRDVKPENLMLCTGSTPGMRRRSRATIKIVDFGTAKRLGPGAAALTADGKILGTPQYMSPECARGERITGAADVYAVAIMTYEMLAGRVPFDDRIPVKVVARQIAHPPPPMQGVHPALEQAVLAGLAEDPTLRPSAVQFHRSFALALQEAASDVS